MYEKAKSTEGRIETSSQAGLADTCLGPYSLILALTIAFVEIPYIWSFVLTCVRLPPV